MIDVYLHISPSGKAYVGIASQGIKERLRMHKKEAKTGTDYPFHRALRKYEDASQWRSLVLEQCEDWPAAQEAERFWIDAFATRVPGGYNATAGGDGMPNPCDETRQKLSAAVRRAMARPGTRERVSVSRTVAWAAPGAREARSEKMRALWATPEYRERQRTSQAAAHARPEVFARCSAAQRKAWVARRAKGCGK